jgi:hypothetical protein
MEDQFYICILFSIHVINFKNSYIGIASLASDQRPTDYEGLPSSKPRGLQI